MKKNPKPPTKDPTDGAVTAACSCRLAMMAGAGVVAASQHPGDNWGAMVLALFLYPVVLSLGIPRSLLNPEPCAEKPFCTGSAPLGLVLFST